MGLEDGERVCRGRGMEGEVGTCDVEGPMEGFGCRFDE